MQPLEADDISRLFEAAVLEKVVLLASEARGSAVARNANFVSIRLSGELL
jgi:hypothetical protein